MHVPSPAEELFIQFLQDFLGIEYQGLQSGCGVTPDQILFAGPALDEPGNLLHGQRTTLAVPCSIMLLPQAQALTIIQHKRADALRPPLHPLQSFINDSTHGSWRRH